MSTSFGLKPLDLSMPSMLRSMAMPSLGMPGGLGTTAQSVAGFAQPVIGGGCLPSLTSLGGLGLPKLDFTAQPLAGFPSLPGLSTAGIGGGIPPVPGLSSLGTFGRVGGGLTSTPSLGSLRGPIVVGSSLGTLSARGIEFPTGTSNPLQLTAASVPQPSAQPKPVDGLALLSHGALAAFHATQALRNAKDLNGPATFMHTVQAFQEGAAASTIIVEENVKMFSDLVDKGLPTGPLCPG